MKAPEQIATERLLLRKPTLDDAQEIFDRYSSDPEVTRYLGWPMHTSVDETRAFLEWSDAEWERWPAGPYLITLPGEDRLLGGTGLGFETAFRATTGYVLAKDAWGKGYATEALLAMRSLAAEVGLKRLYAMCYPDHQPSRRVLEKGGFRFEGTLHRYLEFPNLHPGEAADVVSYAWIVPDD
ncbi:MAG: GNAT family protein [Woeseiaceae bacterium]|nr:GNAT family protein [Woeseiaceae bacterium]